MARVKRCDSSIVFFFLPNVRLLQRANNRDQARYGAEFDQQAEKRDRD